jgi:hypothetical protein
MKTLELDLSEAAFNKLEKYRRANKLSRNEAVNAMIEAASLEEKWWQEINRRTPAARKLTSAEADRIATEEVRAERRSRRR